MLRHLERVIPDWPDCPDGADETHPMRKVTRQVAFDPGGWTRERAGKVAALFDSLAPEWHTRDHAHRMEPLADALERGGPFTRRVCLELGSGTGLVTPALADRFELVVALDLSAEMLRRAPTEAGARVQGDSAWLPLRTGSADVVVLVNMLLFPAEVDRVLGPGGALVWVNTAGHRTPIHLSAEDVEAAMPGTWNGVHADAAWGTWAVLRRAAAA